MAEKEQSYERIYESMPNDLPSDAIELEVEKRSEVISGFDKNFINLYIYRPALRGGPLPCVIYMHGGGAMTFLKAETKVYQRWCKSLAASGLIVVSVDYRNARDVHTGFYPFPASLNDICAAIQYCYSNRDRLDLRNIILQGEGGGGNLACAAAIKAKKEGWIHNIDGVYAYQQCLRLDR
jgi:acetyl esterase/lipase